MFDVGNIIQSGGLLLIALLIFAESGMFVGFFFPGDTLLLSAGVFAAQGKIELASVIAVVAGAAILGDNIGYLIGRRFGRELFDKPNSTIFRQDYLHRAEAFFTKYGSKAMLLAHFVPIVRTFAPAVAGTAEMRYRLFFLFDAIGDIAWAVSVTLIGYYFGSKIPNIDNYIMVVVAVVVLVVLAPTVYHYLKSRRERQR